VAAVVGCVLSAINEGTQLAAGPFLVASYAYLTAARIPR